MASQSETGHAKNLANFNELITVIKTFGTTYQPSAVVLKIPALETQSLLAEQALDELKQAETLAKQATTVLQDHFKVLNTLTSQMMGSLISSGANANSIEEARSIQKTITGGNSKKKTTTATTASATVVKVTRSQSRQSYDSRLDNFNKLITVLQNVPEYVPNEENLKIVTLQAKVQAMKLAIKESDNKEQLRNQAMSNRNVLLYTTDTGVVDTGLKIKEYVKAAFGGVKSAEYKTISKIKFSTKAK